MRNLEIEKTVLSFVVEGSAAFDDHRERERGRERKGERAS